MLTAQRRGLHASQNACPSDARKNSHEGGGSVPVDFSACSRACPLRAPKQPPLVFPAESFVTLVKLTMAGEVSPEVMLAFYKRLYPYKSIFGWLNHEHVPTKRWTHREWAFTLPPDTYVRYQSFSDADDLKKQVCQLNPTRFEIGPVYSARVSCTTERLALYLTRTTQPRDRKTVRAANFTPQLRELVFDIDMTDYDEIRTCCSGADICHRCWAFIAAAVHVLDESIREQFGYKHLLWVYSGRRGIHLWISDKEAMELTNEQRRALVGNLTVIQGGKEMKKKVNVRQGTKPAPPSIT